MDIFVYVAACAIVGITAVLLQLLTFVRNQYLSRKHLLSIIPTGKYHWFYGHLHDFPGINEKGLLYLSELTKQHPRYFLLLLGPFRTPLMLNHPETIHQLTQTTEPKALDGNGVYRFLKPWFGDGILLSNGAKWSRNKKLLQPAFNLDILKRYTDIFNDCTDILIAQIDELACSPKTSIEVFDQVCRCSFDIISRCAFSMTQNVQTKQHNTYIDIVKCIASQIIHRVNTPYLHPDIIYYRTQQGKTFIANCNMSHAIASEIIQKRKLELNTSDREKPAIRQRRTDFLDTLLLAKDEDGSGLSDQEILDEVETFMAAGHDTTTSGVSWLLYNLARHPNIQSKVQAEIDALLNDRTDDHIQWRDLNKLPYLTQCIKESLRLYPPVYQTGRQLTNPLEMDGKLLPEGTFIHVDIWSMHHNPTVWPDPFRYDPNRFTASNMKQMHSHAFLPFSAGPRNCIGKNFAMNVLKVMSARILHSYKLSVDHSKQVKILPEIVLHAENGIDILFKRRDAKIVQD